MDNPTIRFFSADDVNRLLSMEQAIEEMRDAFIQLSTKEAVVPARMNLEIPKEKGRILFMPVYLPGKNQIGLKVVSLFDENPKLGLPLIQALVLVFDSHTGKPLAILDGKAITSLRTGAASGLATLLLAREDSEIVAIFGAGVQGRTQLEAVHSVRNLKMAYVFDPIEQFSSEYAKEMSERLSIQVKVARSPDVLLKADIICTATTSPIPVFSHSYLKPGVHINAVGAYQPDKSEIPVETVVNAKVVVDHREASLTEAGDLIIPINNGLIEKNHIYAEIGEIAAGIKEGRKSKNEITLFKSVGNAVQDLAAASRILSTAKELDLGTELTLS